MGTSRATGYLERVRGALRVAFAEDHPPRFVAASFSVGVFFTTLPTLGAALPVLAWIGYHFHWANRLSLFASVAVLNPLAKTGVYAASFVVGTVLLGPVPGITRSDIGLSAGSEVLVRLLVGNAILAVVLSIVGYFGAYKAVKAYRRR